MTVPSAGPGPGDDPLDRLDARQRTLLDVWLPGAVVLADHSWGLVPTRVLEVEHAGERYAVKAAGPDDTHLPRELEAHRRWTGPWVRAGRGPELVHADPGARLLVTRWVPGVLAVGTPAQHDPGVHRQAGALLAALHAQERVVDADLEARENARALAWLDRPHGLEPDAVRRVRDVLAAWSPGPVTTVPAHGDFQPRNWVVDAGVVRVIDLGRAALRPAASDLVRMSAQEWRDDPSLADAFVEGYGSDPRDAATWWVTSLREGVCTAGWARMVGDAPFEAQGLRMVDEALARL